MTAIEGGERRPVAQRGVLYCSNCESRFGLEPLLYCPLCKEGLEYLLPIDETKRTGLKRSLLTKNRPSPLSGHFRFIELLPVSPGVSTISLGEGNTPLLHCEYMQQKYFLSRLYLKDEGMNPTGSWKDRPVSLAVTCARSFGCQTISVYSCGNAGAATAAYAAQAGMKSVIFVLPTVDRKMCDLMVSYGGCVVPIEISRRELWKSSRVGEVLEEALCKLGWFPATTHRNPYVGSPYYTEGFKTIAYEIFLDLGEAVPDWVFVPAGTGEGLCGIWRGFKNLHALGVTSKLPRIIGVQADSAAPLVCSYRQSKKQVDFVEGSKTIAAGLEVMISSNQALRAIQESHGSAESVDDSAIYQAMVEIRQEEGVNASSEGAVSLAAAKKFRSEGRLKEDDLIVCISSSTGLKYSEPEKGKEIPRSGVPLDLSEISDYVNSCRSVLSSSA